VLQYRPGAYWVGDNTVEADFALNDRVAKMKWVSLNIAVISFTYVVGLVIETNVWVTLFLRMSSRRVERAGLTSHR
jgi:hypothetical protein